MKRILQVNEHSHGNGKPLTNCFGYYESVDILLESLRMTYPDVKNRIILTNVIYTESDGFSWSCHHIGVLTKPEIM